MPSEIEEQHPIPSDIASYQFKLVGDMTLKQFLQVAGGALIALLLYASPLHGAIKWPLVLISFLFGIALAFMPLEDRPLDKWIIAFFRSIYTPTIFVFKKPAQPPVFFQPEAVKAPGVQQQAKPKGQRLQQVVPSQKEATQKISGTIFLSQEESKALNKLEKQEKTFLEKVTSLFKTQNLMGKTGSQSTQSKGVIQLPKPITVSVTPQEKQQPKKPKSKPQETPELEKQIQTVTSQVAPTLQQSQIKGKVATFSTEPGTPPSPTSENVVVGQVLTPDGKIIEGAILEIKDEEGRPVRALKTNKLGHFMIVTPLFEGKYEIIIEKPGYTFDPVEFKAEGKIIPPISIKAKSFNESELLNSQNLDN